MTRSRVTVLAYHRVATPGNSDLSPALIDAYPAEFEAQMRYVAARYNVVSSWDLVRALREGYTLPAKALIITFDDGYRCFAEVAMPMLRRLGLPVTLFVPTAFPGSPGKLFWWDTLHRALSRTHKAQIEVAGVGVLPMRTPGERYGAYSILVPYLERIREQEAARLLDGIVEQCEVEPNTTPHMLNWEEIAALEAEGVTIGPHTQSHIILAQAGKERVQAEVAGSWADLQAKIARPLPIFCYPNGKPHAINRVVMQAVRDAGLAGAYTMVAGLNVVGRTDPYLLYRVGMEPGQSLRRFAFKLSLAGRVYRRLKSLATRTPLEV
ncbi:MAG TPA: polysaccharide deacetylase family protein, partial [Chloroflexia bacterium]|nr:polysaccharide deacetylase family protein [Chloroflexia bacterium]